MGLFHRAPKLAANQPSPPSPPRPQSIDELEQQMALEAKAAKPQARQSPSRAVVSIRRLTQRLVGVAVLIGIPIGAIALINLPYAPIRRPIAQKAPFLLLPSYIGMDQNFRQAAANLEEAEQLINNATTTADLDRGEQKLKQAQTNLNNLPTWVWSELPDTQTRWYGWHFSSLSLNNARAEIGRLQGKLFQEKNAEDALSEAEQTLGTATQQYQEAQTTIEKQAAMRVWQDALDQLRQIPPATLASKTAERKLAAAQRDFQALGGSAVSNQQSANLIAAARQFGQQAAQAGLNPPHSVKQWQQVIDLWQEAIERLEQVPKNDAAYLDAQKLLATYSSNLGIIKTRQQVEGEAVNTLREAKEQIANLLADTHSEKAANRNYTIGQLQRIIDRLKQIESGTTAYPEAQPLLRSATDKLNQFRKS